jgi:hypothetical protein
MRRAPDLILYLAVFVLFGSVLLWVQSAEWPLIAVGGFASLVLVGLAALGARRRLVLLVGERSGRVDAIGAALEEAGYDVCSCAGPSNRPCPVLLGRRCPLSERPIAAMMCHPDGEPYAPCGMEFRVPSVIVEERLDGTLRHEGAVARMGPHDGPARLVTRMQDLLAA